MSKRGRADDESREEEVRRAIELIRGTPAARQEANGLSLTPLEKQVVTLKESIPPHVVLLVACGYRVKFYGRDSRVISRRSGIMCIPAQPFEYSSVPYTRVELYVRRLVAMGYHVGFADQESAAVRALEGVKSGVFQRTVSQLYSRGTLLPNERIAANGSDDKGGANTAEEEEDGAEDSAGVRGPHGQDWIGSPTAAGGDASELFMCFVEAPLVKVEAAADTAAALRLTLVSFVTRSRETLSVTNALALEDVIQRFDIVEVVILAHSQSQAGAAARSIADYMSLLPEKYASVLQHTLPLHFGPTPNGEEDGNSVSVSGYTIRQSEDGESSLDRAIAAYLSPYKLDKVYEEMCGSSSQASNGAVASHDGKDAVGKPQATLSLPGSSLRALDVFHSSAGPQGSLLSVLDHTVTPCGARKLRAWLAAPLADAGAIRLRQSAVTYLRGGGDDGHLEDILRECGRVGDVEATVGKLHAQRCGVLEYTRLLRLVRAAHTMASELLSGGEAEKPPPLVAELLSAIAGDAVAAFIQSRKAEMDTTATTPLELYTGKGRGVDNIPATIQEQLAARDHALKALDAELERVRSTLRLPGLEYRTIGGTSLVIDVPNGKVDRVPKDWLVLTRTKTNVRYHTPTIVEEHIALSAAKDRLVAAAGRAWQEDQAWLSSDTAALRALNAVIGSIATLDALRSLSVASARPGYVAPVIVGSDEATHVHITAGRHPVLDILLNGGYVSCDVSLSAGGTWLLTGPNMGGKSALMRMIGCFVVLAQLGCHVPAAAATLPVFDGLYCRMGSGDSVLEGSSTFLMEMEETSRILRAPHLSSSLVLMDELGRGTSSFDGVAVAAATLDYLVSHKVTTVFVTHYSYLCDPYLDSNSASSVECFYMGFREEDSAADSSHHGHDKRLVFTYKPTRGVTPSSFGVDIARMAGLPERVTAQARVRSALEEKLQTQRMALPVIAQFLAKNVN